MAKILVVEDNEVNQRILVRRLERRGFDVVVAEDGAQGVDVARREIPDLILMDMSLPVMDGWEATRELKSAPTTSDIPIIALTAHAMVGDRERAMAAGCNDYDVKPVELDRLLGKIDALLGDSPLVTEPAASGVSRHDLRTPVHHILGCSDLLLDEAEDDSSLADLVPTLRDIQAAGKQVLALVERWFEGGAPSDKEELRAQLEGIAERCALLQARVPELDRGDLLPDVWAIESAVGRLLGIVAPQPAPSPLEGEGWDGGESHPRPSPSPARGEGVLASPLAGEAGPLRGPGEGASPAASPTSVANPHPRPHPAGDAASTTGRLLVVDDNDANRDILARHLERLGYSVARAENGRAALEALEADEIDLVLLDVMMPEMDGYQVLERRRGDARLRDIPFIMISALDEMDSVVRCIEMGAEDYLPKPFDPVLLRARISACLEKKRLHDQERRYLATIQAQSAELAELNRTLEARVVQQVDDIVRLRRLQRFLSPQIADAIISSGEQVLQPHRREITVAFCDLRGFTAFAETAEPEDLMDVLRQYHAAMGELIFQFEGTLERFTGDGMMIFFNDPVPCEDPAERAVRMALAMRERAGLLAVDWRRRGHQLGFGVGIASGYATLGRIGFEGRVDYGAIGSVTNLAARLCGEAAPRQVLISQRVYAAVDEMVEAEPVGELELRGFTRPVTTFNVLGLKSER